MIVIKLPITLIHLISLFGSWYFLQSKQGPGKRGFAADTVAERTVSAPPAGPATLSPQTVLLNQRIQINI